MNVLLKLKQYGNRINASNEIVKDILKNHGVKDVNQFINIEDYDCPMTNADNYKFMTSAANTINLWVKKGAEIGIVIDDDADGYTSSAMLYQYLNQKIKTEKSKSKLTPIISPHKEHGFCKLFEKYEFIKDMPKQVIIPDAGSNDVDYMTQLKDAGISFVILDHHDIEKQAQQFFEKNASASCLLVNNMAYYNDNPNKELTGVGMVYKTLQTLNEITNKNYKISKSLFAIGEIADCADVSNLEIRKIMVDGLKNIDNKFLKQYFPGEYKRPLAPIKLSFSIIPRINAIARIGSIENRKMLLNALSENVEDGEFITVTKRRKSKVDGKFHHVDISWTYYEYTKDCFDKLKSKQDKFVKDAIKNIQYLSNQNFVLGYLDENDENLGSVIGLIANKIMAKTQKPVILVHEFNKGIYNGSLRAPGILPFKTILNQSKLFNFVAGHEQAAGVEFKIENLNKIIKKFENYDFNIDAQEIDVDVLFSNVDTGAQNLIANINNYEDVFGGKIPNPILGFKNLIISKNKISSRGKTASFYWNNVKFMMFNGAPLKAFLENGFSRNFNFDIAGEIMTDWNDNPMIAIDFFDGKEVEDEKPQKVKEKQESNESKFIMQNGEFIF